MKRMPRPTFRQLLTPLVLLGAGVALVAVLAAATVGFTPGRVVKVPPPNGAADPPSGAVADPGNPAIGRFEHPLVSPVATDGRLAYYAATDSAGWVAMSLDPETGIERAIGPVGDVDGILAVGRTPAGTVFAGSSRVALVRDSGEASLLALPAPVRGVGLEGAPYVEGIAVLGDRVFLARFNDRDILELKTSGGLSVARVHTMPEGVSPPKQIRPLEDGRLLVATAYSSKDFGPGAWVVDVAAGVAERVSGLAAPDLLSATGALMALDEGRVTRVEPGARAVTPLEKRGPGLASLAADARGGFWYHNHRGPGDITWTDATLRRIRVFALPTRFGYPGEPFPEDGKAQKPLAPVARAPGVRSMVTLANGDLVFSASGHEFIGVIRNPDR
jgi:hypothetical protein